MPEGIGGECTQVRGLAELEHRGFVLRVRVHRVQRLEKRLHLTKRAKAPARCYTRGPLLSC